MTQRRDFKRGDARRIAVIGAGPSGMAALRAFESAARKGATST